MAWTGLMPRRQKAKPRIPAGTRVYAVGDVHGRADLLSLVLARIDEDIKIRPTAQPVQVFLGDYIDRGPDSRRVLDLLIARNHKDTTVFLKGNHELYASEVLSDHSVVAEWLRMGGIPTLLSYGVKPSAGADPKADEDTAIAFGCALPDSHRRFLHGLALSFTCGDFFFVHAGVRPGIALQQQWQQDLIWIRDDFLLHEDDFGKIVVHGHTPAREPDVRPNRINIDTGAYATGRLTCLVLEGDQMRFL